MTRRSSYGLCFRFTTIDGRSSSNKSAESSAAGIDLLLFGSPTATTTTAALSACRC